MKNLWRGLLAVCVAALAATGPLRAQKTAAPSENGIDSLKKIIAETRSDTTRARSLCRLCRRYRNIERLDLAFDASARGLSEAEQADDRIGQAYCHNQRGILFSSQGDYQEGLRCFELSRALYAEAGDSAEAVKLQNNLGLIYHNLGKLSMALEAYQDYLQYHNRRGNRAETARAYQNIGAIYYDKGTFELALRYQRMGLAAARQARDAHGEALGLLNIANIYHDQGRRKDAEEYFGQSLPLFEQARDARGLSGALHGLGVIALEAGRREDALGYFEQNYEIAEAIRDAPGASRTLANMSAALRGMGRLDEAKARAETALAIARQTGAAERIAFAALAAARADSALGNMGAAYERLRLHKQYADSLHDDRQNREIGRLEAEFQFGKRLEARRRAEADDAERRRRYAVYAAVAFAVLLALLGLAGAGFRIKQKSEKQLRVKNEEISQKSEEIRQQAEEIRTQNDVIGERNRQLSETLDRLEELSDFKELLTSTLVHDLKNPLSVALSLAQSPNLEERREPLMIAVRQMQNLTMNMLDVQKFETAEVKLEKAALSARKLAADALAQVQPLAERKALKLQNEIPADLAVDGDASYLVRVLVNVLNNAIKFSPNNGRIVLEAARAENGMINVAITDDGPGIPPDKLDKVFDKFAKLEDKAGVNTKGTGLGLAFCKMAAEAHGGSIRAENAPEAGARFRLTLPEADGRDAAPAPGAPLISADVAERPLTPAERAAIAPVAAEMRRFEVYETSELTDALAQLEGADLPGVRAWRRRAENAVYSLNEAALHEAIAEAERPV